MKKLPVIALLLSLIQSAAAAQEAKESSQTEFKQSETLRSIAPALANRIGFNNGSYAASVPIESSHLTVKERVERFTAPDGKLVAISIAAPQVNEICQVPPIKTGENPIEYFAKAISNAGPHKTILFPKDGVYNFLSNPNGGPHLKLGELSDVVIDGNGSVLNFAVPRPGLSLIGPNRVVMKNFTIDWPRLQISSLATITASGGNGPKHFTYDLQIDPEYVRATPPKSYKAIFSWDAKHSNWSLVHTDNGGGYTPGQVITDSGAAHNVPSWTHKLDPGEHALLRHYTTEGDAIDIYHGQDVTLQNITIYTSPGFGIAVLDGSSGLIVSNCKVTRAEGRPISTAADALHISNSAGNIIVENNIFAYQGDDGLNINAHLFPISTDGTKEITVPNKFGYIKQGDKVALFDSEMQLNNSHSWRIAEIIAMPGGDKNKLILNSEIPMSVKGGYLADLSFCGARYIVRNNQFLFNRGRGALLQTPYGLVEGNKFRGQTMFGIFLTTFPPEGLGAQNLVIAGNTVSDAGLNGGPGAITVSRQDHIYSKSVNNRPVHQNIIFKDNEVRNVTGPAFYISAANDVILLRNSLKNTNLRKMKNIWNDAGDLNYPIVINDASNIVLRENAIEASAQASNPILIDKATTSDIEME